MTRTMRVMLLIDADNVSSDVLEQAVARTAPPAADVQRILRAVPALGGGNEVALNDIAKLLRADGLLGKNASSIKLFDKLPADFEVLKHPDRIRWTGARGS